MHATNFSFIQISIFIHSFFSGPACLPLCWWTSCSDRGLCTIVVSGAAAAAADTDAQTPAARGNPFCWSRMTGRSPPVSLDTLLSRPLHSLSLTCSGNTTLSPVNVILTLTLSNLNHNFKIIHNHERKGYKNEQT